MVPKSRSLALIFSSLSAVGTLLGTPCAAQTAAPSAQPAGTPSPRPPAGQMALGLRAVGDRFSMPIVRVKEFPFVEATVNGVRGKLMLDTGSRWATSLNDHRIPLKDGRGVGTGFFGSGQHFDIRVNPTIASVQLPGRTYHDIRNVESQSAEQLEGITPDFIGWLGYDFWKGYAIKLDYKKNRVTFYRDPVTTPKKPTFLEGETVIATIHYEMRKLANHPVVKVRIGGIDFDGAFDSGQFGGIWIDPETKAQLIKAGRLALPSNDAERGTLKGVEIADGGTYDLPVDVLSPPFAAAAPLGLTAKNVITFGFNLLDRYTTVWDYSKKTIYLLKRR